jgi:purine-binding chemotaxis protein CheW
MRGLSFLVDGELFAVDATLVMKVISNVKVTSIPAAPDAVVGLLNLKGMVVTILNLAALLGRRWDRGDADSVKAVIFKPLESGGDQMGLCIDVPGDLIEIDKSKMLPLPLESRKHQERTISGLAETEGKLYRIIDVASIINCFADIGRGISDTSHTEESKDENI